jgi:hypothetical protein
MVHNLFEVEDAFFVCRVQMACSMQSSTIAVVIVAATRQP